MICQIGIKVNGEKAGEGMIVIVKAVVKEEQTETATLP